jgi:hypothetical protein
MIKRSINEQHAQMLTVLAEIRHAHEDEAKLLSIAANPRDKLDAIELF